jgi:hypothetical protein
MKEYADLNIYVSRNTWSRMDSPGKFVPELE